MEHGEVVEVSLFMWSCISLVICLLIMAVAVVINLYCRERSKRVECERQWVKSKERKV